MEIKTDGYKTMGIINLTDNSFVSSSRMAAASIDEIVGKALWMVDMGASYIDIGACSSAPGNSFIDEDLEWKRMHEPLKAIMEAIPGNVEISIDTFRSGIIERCLGLGRSVVVNDIFAGLADERMLDMAASNKLCYIAMDQTPDPYSFFEKWAEQAAGKGLDNWILDPGFGFGKTVEGNWDIMEQLPRFKDFGRPILSATSRKRMIYMPLGLKPESCAQQSVQAELKAVQLGADIIRTHDLDLHRQHNSGK